MQLRWVVHLIYSIVLSLLSTTQDDIIRQAHGHAVMFMFQFGLERAETMTKQRRAASDLRSTLGWSEVQEEEWKQAIDKCSTLETLWVGMSS